jgi:SAM-dependent methyltransferase
MTPRSVALEVGAMAAALGDHTRLLDPACGHGALLLGALEAGVAEPSQIVGFDIDPMVVAQCEVVVWLAAGQPDRPVGRFEVRDALGAGFAQSVDAQTILVANPPWGVKPSAEALASWRSRVGPDIAGLLKGEVNIYTLFLLESLLVATGDAVFLTPIHWLHGHSLARLRAALSETGQLRELFVLRKRVFPGAPDMIPVISAWGAPESDPGVRVRRTGFNVPIPLSFPLPVEATRIAEAEEWSEMPLVVYPLLRSEDSAQFARRFIALTPRMSDPGLARTERLLHFGDGVYKTNVMEHLGDPETERHILTRAEQTGRYRLDKAERGLTPEGRERLTAGERRRFGANKLILHAIKKASATWRLAAAHHASTEAPLILTNNFLIAVAEDFDGDLHYPLALLNSRLFNRLYTEHFPGVNIEAYTVGSLPLPWPPRSPGPAAPEPGATVERFREWSRRASGGEALLTRSVYDWLRSAANELMAGAENRALDSRIEAVVEGLFD